MLLQVCQDVADVVGVQRPSAVVTSLDQLARQMYGLAKETLDELSLMDWPILVVPATLPTVVDQTAYPLPADFEHEIGDTLYLANRYDQVRGALSPGDWARQRNTYPDLGRFRFRIFGNPLTLNLTPPPKMAEQMVYEYKTNLKVRRSDGTLGVTYANDDDTSIVPEGLVYKGLKWRLKRAKGLDYTEEFDDYELSRNQRLAQQLAFASMPVAYRSPFDAAEIAVGYVPESGFGP